MPPIHPLPPDGGVTIRWAEPANVPRLLAMMRTLAADARAIGFYQRLGARLAPKGLCTWVPR